MAIFGCIDVESSGSTTTDLINSNTIFKLNLHYSPISITRLIYLLPPPPPKKSVPVQCTIAYRREKEGLAIVSIIN